MTSSRSKASTSKRWLVLAFLVAGLGGLGTAHADKRKRVVILPFEGEKAEKFHEAVVKLVKKSHTVVSAEKWESAAEELSASKVSEKNIKKVAKKLKIDGVIEGKVEKRRDQYMIKLKLHAGTTGAVASKVDTKADGPRLDAEASRDLKDELIGAISELDSNRVGKGDDEEEEEPKAAKKKAGKGDDEEDEPKAAKKKAGKGDDEEEEPKAAKKKAGKGDDEEDEPKAAKSRSKSLAGKGDDEEEEPKKPSKFGGTAMKPKKGDDEEAALKPKQGDDEEENPLPAKKKRPKKGGDGEDEVATKGGEDEEIEERAEPGEKMDKALALSPGNRAIDATLGLSISARRLSWKTAGDLAPSMGVAGQGKPPNYKGTPAPGAVLDLTAYPLAFGHKSDGMLKNAGVTVMYDKALLISSEAGGQKKDTAAQRFAVGAVFRYPFGKSATSPVIGGRLRFGKQKFQIQGPVDLPNVNYTIIDPGVFFRYPVSEKIVLNANLSYMLFSNTGQMQKADQYGAATVSGFEGEIGGDYAITGAIFARAAIKLETIGFTFKGKGALTTGRDADMEVDVFGARDTYLGAAFTVGYLY